MAALNQEKNNRLCYTRNIEISNRIHKFKYAKLNSNIAHTKHSSVPTSRNAFLYM